MKNILYKKYRPETIDGYIFQNENNERIVTKWIEQQSIPNVLMIGSTGIGKSTLARILINELDVDDNDVLYVNGSTENGIDFIRNRLVPWLNNSSLSGGMKIVQYEEFDRLSPNAQDALREIIETTDNARFICTANNKSKLTPAIIGRFETGTLNMSGINEEGIEDLVLDVIEGENITYEDDEIVLAHIDKFKPDVRRILSSIEKMLDSDNVLHMPEDEDTEGNDIYAWEDLWSEDGVMDEDDLSQALQLTELVDNNNFEFFYTTMYNNHHRLPCVREDIIKIADYLYKASSTAANQRLLLDACLYHIFAVE